MCTVRLIAGVLLSVLLLAAPANADWSEPLPISPEGVDVAAAQALFTHGGPSPATRVFALHGPSADGGKRLTVAAAPAAGDTPAPAPIELASGPAFAFFGARLAADGLGHAYIAWTDQGAVHVARRAAADGALTETSLGAGATPDVAANAAGKAAVAWFGTPADGRSLRVAIRAAGEASAFSAPVELADAIAASYPSARVAVNAAGDAVVTWSAEDGDGLYVRVLRADGTLSATTQLSSRVAADVQLTAAGTRVLALWTDKAGASWVGGDVRSATIDRDGPVAGTPQTIGAGDRAAGYFGKPRVVARDDGHVLVVWNAIRVTSQNSGQGVGNVVQEGDLDDGPLDPSAQQLPRDAWGGQLAMDPDALAFGDDGRTLVAYAGMRVSLRPAGQTELPLPVGTSCLVNHPIAAGFEDMRMVLLADRPGSLAPTRRVYVNHDGAPAPAPCIPGPSSAQDPYQPQVGEETTFNLSVMRDPDGVPTDWAWDFDADGTIDLGPGEHPVVHRTYATASDKHVIATITVHSVRDGDQTRVHHYRFNVRERNLLPFPTLSPQTGTTAAARPAAKLEAPSRLRLWSLRSKGLSIRVRAPAGGTLKATLSRSATTLASVRRKVEASSTSRITLRPKLSRTLRRKRSFALVLRVRMPGGKVLRRTILVRR